MKGVIMQKATSPQQFKELIIKNLSLIKSDKTNYIEYRNTKDPKSYIRLYQKENFYEFGLANYHIPQDFQIHFESNEQLLRLGILFDGITSFEIEENPNNAFYPSSFIVLENNIKGIQYWKKGEYYKGAEITIYPAYLKELAKRHMLFQPEQFLMLNHTYHHLPSGILPTIHQLLRLDKEQKLNLFYLESAILNIIGSIIETSISNTQNVFHPQIDYGNVRIGKKHTLHFSKHDYQIIQDVHDYLLHHYVQPPTIEAISKQFLINPQKLKAGFSFYFQLTISQFITLQKMHTAVTLLCTTEKSIQEIAQEVGYAHTANFTRRFQATYHCTPLKYRYREKRKLRNTDII